MTTKIEPGLRFEIASRVRNVLREWHGSLRNEDTRGIIVAELLGELEYMDIVLLRGPLPTGVERPSLGVVADVLRTSSLDAADLRRAALVLLGHAARLEEYERNAPDADTVAALVDLLPRSVAGLKPDELAELLLRSGRVTVTR